MAKAITLDELARACKKHGVSWPTNSADAPYKHDSISLALYARRERVWAAFHAHWKERGFSFYEEHYGAPLGFVLERANRVIESLD